MPTLTTAVAWYQPVLSDVERMTLQSEEAAARLDWLGVTRGAEDAVRSRLCAPNHAPEPRSTTLPGAAPIGMYTRCTGERGAEPWYRPLVTHVRIGGRPPRSLLGASP